MRVRDVVHVAAGVGAGVAWVACVGGSTACGKSPIDAPIAWHRDPELAIAQARVRDKPLVVFVGAEWDAGSKEIEHRTFTDPRVQMLVRHHFVALHVDATDDEAPGTSESLKRFKVVGTPSILVLAADGTSELARFHSVVEPSVLVRRLVAARASNAARKAAL